MSEMVSVHGRAALTHIVSPTPCDGLNDQLHVPTSDDPVLTLNSYYMRSVTLHTSFGAHHKNLNEDRSILSATKM